MALGSGERANGEGYCCWVEVGPATADKVSKRSKNPTFHTELEMTLMMTVELSSTYGQKEPGLSVMIAEEIGKGLLLYNENVTK